MARFYDIDADNAALPELQGLLSLLREHRADLIRLRDEVLERQERVEAGSSAGRPSDPPEAATDPELRRLRLRMQGLIDQMQAAVVRIDELDVTLRDIETGLIDFPALAGGRQIWLCWRLGEGPIEWWHELTTGVAGRLPLAELT